VDILVATPGRLLDLIGQRHVNLGRVEVLVLDEADRMFDMGFIRDIRKIIAKVPEQRQTMLFSATMPSSIMNLANSILKDHVDIRITPEAPAAETVDHTIYFVERHHKQDLLQHLLVGDEISRALVFARTKRGADRVVLHLQHANISAEVIHSDKTQGARQKALDDFKCGRVRVLVASDIASRGLDVDDISHVINYDIPDEAETYVHRIGRTGRAGQAGRALSFCGLDERSNLRAIERLLKCQLPAAAEHPFKSAVPARPTSLAPVSSTPTSWRKLGRGRGRSLGWIR
jgi:ATP-dependent RNA helicase RhlE